MKSSRLGWILGTAGVLVAVLGVALFVSTHHLVTTSEPVGPSGRALRDPFWAATLLLQELGVPTAARFGLGQLPPPDSGAVVLVLADDPDQRAALATRLVDWADRGGHVVLAPPSQPEFDWVALLASDPGEGSTTGPDPLLEAFGVTSITMGNQTWSEPTVVTVEQSGLTGGGTVEALVTRSRVGVSSEYCDAVVGEASPDPTVSTDRGARTQLRARCRFGAGHLSVVSSTDFFENNHLRDERGDNAAFLWDTLAADAAPTEAILVLRGDAPSFLALIWNRGWPLLTSLGLLFVAWAIRAGQRFGPTLDQPIEARRSMLEHLDASGAMLWRHHRQEGLVSAMRQSVRTRLARQRPAIAHLQGDALACAVADLTHHPVPTIRQALVDPPPRERQAFIELVQLLQQLWKHASNLHLEKS